MSDIFTDPHDMLVPDADAEGSVLSALSERVGCVVIGRNEGERLRLSLHSALAVLDKCVYVDSGSTDGSPALAQALGAAIVALDPSRPFTAARGRNEGFARLKELWPALEFVQFIDGDCTLADGWLESATSFLDEHPSAALVCGRRREVAPESSPYNALCDMEWDGPVGEITECGGDVLARSQALQDVGGYNPALIAGEEPEMCIRLRAQGWTLWRIRAEMTRHDAAMTTFGQFWRRARRSGHAFAEVSDMHRKSPYQGWSSNARSSLVWGGAMPVAILAGALLHPVVLCAAAIFPLQIARIAKRSKQKSRPWVYAVLTIAGKPPEALGILEYHAGKLRGRRRTLIEYKKRGRSNPGLQRTGDDPTESILAAPIACFCSALTVLLAGLAASVSMSEPASAAATRVVSPTGDDRASGSIGAPWRTFELALERLQPGDTLLVRAGHYALARQARLRVTGSPREWTTIAAYPGETPILDASAISVFAGLTPSPEGQKDNGALQIEGSSFVRVQNVTVSHSADAGITVRDSRHVDILNNTVCSTVSSGIAAWDTLHEGEATQDVRIIGNRVQRATTREPGRGQADQNQELPQEAISVAGAVGFEIADNHVWDGEKEGIDIKETSRDGRVHHNLVHAMGRQGIYVDAWFGRLEDVEIDSNVLFDNRGAWLGISTENGEVTKGLRIHHNLIIDNAGSGIHVTRFGRNGERENIQIYNNTIARNGYGTPDMGRRYYWITGGILLSSGLLRNVEIFANIVAENEGFQIGCGADLCPGKAEIDQALAGKNILVFGNVVHDEHSSDDPIMNDFPPTAVVALYGTQATKERPDFRAADLQDFSIRDGSPAAIALAGAFSGPDRPDFWWQRRLDQDRHGECE